ncbi:NAD-dependent dehydratase [Salegentibacter salinarum]|uniref:NAD-dependent dehydratase n=1 Tax=Salegentibacter salinarum TaxID=447422 RepID=A0A2N0TNB6_9FLAO|nr:SDR family NAD(P)-dependent oxidoreductase [Salegentibacter salinarum]PKD16215.1 NAD-dependent dehydratase [Salegentibacter salinarum]SKB67826.1 CDP-paratose 2-epimerase [Salegentibacter salinarum]
MKEIATKERAKLGILEWFRPGEYKEVKAAINDLNRLGIKHLRTGISWADWHVEGTKEWYDWMIPELSKHFEVLPCFLYTPPSIGEAPKTSSPPKDLKSYSDFTSLMIDTYGNHFDWVELWNEPNNKIEYDYTLDFSWNKFSEMIQLAAYWAKKKGKKTVLGGMSPIDPNWLQMIIEKGTLENIDAVGIHGFPHVFDQQWQGWETNIKEVKAVLSRFKLQKELWISEVGFSTWQNDQVKQYDEFVKVLNCDADRIYWYSLKDLDPKNATVGGFHLDEREYYFGLKTKSFTPKLLYKLLEKEGLGKIGDLNYIQKFYDVEKLGPFILITGGAGFIGTNLAERLLSSGKRVMIYDALVRDGVEKNLKELKHNYGRQLMVQIADINEEYLLKKCIEMADEVYHFASQVAVTTSIEEPETDFDVNLKGTIKLLEAIRKSEKKPPLFFTSTNKVYGDLSNSEFKESKTRYYPKDSDLAKNGINELQPLSFHSPYGCSKGAADQYILDYTRTYDLKCVVFRMSCIYGPHQFGTEDQGWVAHFLISALKGKDITIYGDGKQVRDILYVDDLVDAFMLASQNIEKLSGEAFNIGGGIHNSVSLIELLKKIQKITRSSLDLSFNRWRQGDQLYYVSDTQKFQDATGWKPEVEVDKGIENLTRWLTKNRSFKKQTKISTKKLIDVQQ